MLVSCQVDCLSDMFMVGSLKEIKVHGSCLKQKDGDELTLYLLTIYCKD